MAGGDLELHAFQLCKKVAELVEGIIRLECPLAPAYPVIAERYRRADNPNQDQG